MTIYKKLNIGVSFKCHLVIKLLHFIYSVHVSQQFLKLLIIPFSVALVDTAAVVVSIKYLWQKEQSVKKSLNVVHGLILILQFYTYKSFCAFLNM